MGWVGLEPTTNALKGRCSTIELPTRRERGQFLLNRPDTQPREEITERIVRTFQLENFQPCGGRRGPVALGIVANMQHFPRRQTADFQRATVDERIRFISAELA